MYLTGLPFISAALHLCPQELRRVSQVSLFPVLYRSFLFSWKKLPVLPWRLSAAAPLQRRVTFSLKRIFIFMSLNIKACALLLRRICISVLVVTCQRCCCTSGRVLSLGERVSTRGRRRGGGYFNGLRLDCRVKTSTRD